MARITHHKLSRKELKQPDEFVSFVDSASDFLEHNLARVVLAAVGLFAVVAAASAIHFYLQHQQRMVAEDFYQAMHALQNNDFKGARAGFQALAIDHPDSRLGRLANLYLGSTYMSQKDPAKARPALEAYLRGGAVSPFREMALCELGAAYEDLGDFGKAHNAYLRASQTAGPSKPGAELGVARTLAKQGDKPGAVAAYQQFLRDNPLAPNRQDAIEALAQLGVAPVTPERHAKTIELPGVTGKAATSGNSATH